MNYELNYFLPGYVHMFSAMINLNVCYDKDGGLYRFKR